MTVTTDHLTTGWRFHQAGDLPRAEEAYRRAVEQEPGNAQAWYLLGAACQARGDLTAAAASFRQAWQLKPGERDIQIHLAVVLAQLGQPAEAVALLQAVLRQRPDDAQARTLLRQALALQASATPPAVAFRPTPAAAAENTRGLTYLHQGKLQEAAGRFRQALRLQPEFPDAHYNLGYALACQGKPDEAIRSYQQAIRLRPDYAEAHNNLSMVLRSRKRAAEAEASGREAVRLRPESPEVHINLGMALLDLDRPEEALASLEHAVRLQPGSAQAQNHLGCALQLLGRPEDAAVSLREALRLQPELAEAHTNLGRVLVDLGQWEEALASFARALRIQPHTAEPHWNAALVWLRLGDFAKGLAEYEWRARLPDASSGASPTSRPRWDDSSLAGRTILVYAEQGLGDTLLFIRYARLLKEQGATVIVVCQRPLRRLLAHAPGIDQLVAEGDPLPAHDVQAPLLSLPYHFRTALETIPAQVPYLEADPGLVERWRRELAALPGFKIGINWQGNPRFPLDKQRSFALQEFAPLAEIPGVQLVSLQRGPGSEQLRAVAGQWPITDLGGRLDEEAGPFMDTAAVMKNLDLIVTSDTSIPHLAGALGVPVWVALGKVAYWYFLLEREDSPWYPSMRLFRQERRGEWKAVFQRIAQAVRERL